MILQDTIEHEGDKYVILLQNKKDGEDFYRLQVNSIQTVIEKKDGIWVAKLISPELCQVIGRYIESKRF